MALTPNQLKQLVIDRLTRVGSDRISGADLREVFNEVIDAMGAANVSATIPDWAAGLTFQTDGSDDGAFCVHPDTAGTIRIWKTKIDNNTGNEPPTAPETTENTNWIEASPSSSSALVEWSAGIYGEGLIIVFYNDAFYKLTVPTRPYESEDIEAEIANGDWRYIGENAAFLHKTNTSDQTVASNVSFQKQVKGGANTGSFSATKTFDLNNGNYQKMIVTANMTSLALSNKVSGSSYQIVLEIGGSGSYTIPQAGASFGERTDNSIDDSVASWYPTTVGSKIIYTIGVDPDGDTWYSIETKTV